MLDMKVKILVGIACGMLALASVLTSFVFCLSLKAVKKFKFANRQDVERCAESNKFTQKKIMRAKYNPDESCTLQYCEECNINADSGTLPPCYCGTNKGP